MTFNYLHRFNNYLTTMTISFNKYQEQVMTSLSSIIEREILILATTVLLTNYATAGLVSEPTD